MIPGRRKASLRGRTRWRGNRWPGWWEVPGAGRGEADRMPRGEEGLSRLEIYRFVRSHGLSHDDSEDATQEILLRLWRMGCRGGRGGSGGAGRRLAFEVSRRVVASHYRREFALKRDRRKCLSLPRQDVLEVPIAEPPLLNGEAAMRIREAMKEALGGAHLRALQLWTEGGSYREIAEALGQPVQTVTNYLHRAKQSLRARLTLWERTSGPVGGG